MATPENPPSDLVPVEDFPASPLEPLSGARLAAPPASSTLPNDLPGPLRLVLRVGFAGTQKLPEDSAPLLAALEKIFQTIARRLDEIAPGTPVPCVGPEPLVRHFYSKDKPVLRVITGLCEGADALAATALGKDFKPLPDVDGELAAVLPFSLKTYRKTRPDWFRKTFDEQAKKCAYILVLDGKYEKPDPDTERAKARRARGYRGQSMLLLRQADLIVALADSKGGGRAGGTMETVRAALEFELPVVFVDAGTAAISLIEPEENFSAVLDDLVHTRADWENTLRDWITRIVADPNAVNRDDKHHARNPKAVYENDLLTEFFTDRSVPPLKSPGSTKLRTSRGGRYWDRFRRWFRVDSVAPPSSPTERLKTDPELQPYSRWRDRGKYLNQYYSDLYRGTFFLNYLLAAAAVGLAALSLTALTYYYYVQGHGRAEPPVPPNSEAEVGQASPGVQTVRPTPRTENLAAHTDAVGTAPPPAPSASAAETVRPENATPAVVIADANRTEPHPGPSAPKPGEAMVSPTPSPGVLARGGEAVPPSTHSVGEGAPAGTHHGKSPDDHEAGFDLFILGLLLLGLLKLCFVARILLNTYQAHKGDWNDRAVDYRYVAERLRTMLYLPRIGSFQPPVAAPPQYDSRVVRQSASDWLLDAIVRHVSPAGLPGAKRDSFDIRHEDPPGDPYEVTLIEPNPVEMLKKTRDGWIELQRAYHDGAARSLSRMSEWIDAWIKLLNGAVILIVIADAFLLGGELLGSRRAHEWSLLAPLFICMTAILPAAVAGLLGVRSQSECQRLSERSAVMRNILAGRPASTPRPPKPEGLRAHLKAWWSRLVAFARVCLPFLARPKPAPAVDPTGSRLQAVQKLIDKIKGPPADPHADPDPGAWVAEALRVTESLADVFVREVVEWSVLYAKEVPEP